MDRWKRYQHKGESKSKNTQIMDTWKIYQHKESRKNKRHLYFERKKFLLHVFSLLSAALIRLKSAD
jgi:hypothetical protein